MRKVTDFIVKFRYIFLLIFILLALFCLYLQTKVNINDNIMKYLPKDSETKIGNDIMTDSFIKQDTSYLNVVYKNLGRNSINKTYEKLEGVSGVSSVKKIETREYKGDKYTLYRVNVNDSSDSKLSKNVYENINKNYKPYAMNGSIYDENKPLIKLWIIALSIISALLILIILSDSWFEPFLFLISIGIAVFINKGTNVMFSSVSAITNSIVAVLQLALSMDYSIMLTNRYKQEKKKKDNKIDAMKEALYKSFKAITSSSITTVVGLLALVFMSFTIGKDLGFVLAKGVLLSLICIFCCLPALLLLFDKFLEKTKKIAFKFKLKKLGSYAYKTRYIQTIFVGVLFVVAFLLKGNVNILYTDIQQDKVAKIFETNNQIAIVYDNKNNDKINKFILSNIDNKNIDSILSYDLIMNTKYTSKEITNLIDGLGYSKYANKDIINFIYYLKFDGSIKDNISLNDLFNIVNSSDLLKKYINDNYKIDLSNILGNSNIDLNKKLSVKELASLVNADEKDISLIYIFYNSKIYSSDEWKLSSSEIITYLKELINNNSSYIDKFITNADKAKLLVIENKLNSLSKLFISNKYSRVVINTSLKLEGDDTTKFIKEIKDYFKGDDSIYVVGVSPMAYEMDKSFNSELNKITLLTIIFIFIVVAFTFKDFIIPFVLVLIIQSAVYITMSYITIIGGSVYFIALLIVQAILMGATIDYAIIYTSYYKEARKKYSVKESIIKAYNGSINTIISSSSVLIIVTLIVANFAPEISAEICKTISQGTLCSMLLVLLALPGVLSCFDKVICRKGYFKEENK